MSSSKYKRWIASSRKTGLAMTLLFSLTLIIPGFCFAGSQSLSINSKIPPLELPQFSGEIFNLNSIIEKPIILTFFTTWSKTCIEHLNFLKSIQNKHKNSIEIIAVALDSNISAIDSFKKNNNFPFVILSDKRNRYVNKYQILIIPSTFLIDKDKYLKNIYVDYDEIIAKSIAQDVIELLNPKSQSLNPK